MTDNYGEQIKSYRIKLGLTQNQVATEMDVTPGYISNVENGRTAMSLRLLIYYAKLMGVTLDELVGNLESEYTSNALDNALMAEISKMDDAKKSCLRQLKSGNNASRGMSNPKNLCSNPRFSSTNPKKKHPALRKVLTLLLKIFSFFPYSCQSIQSLPC